MRLRILLYCTCLFLLSSCGSSKKVTSKKKRLGVVLNEPNPGKLPSVHQNEIIRKLKKKNSNLNQYTLIYIKKYAPIAVKEMHDYKIPASITLAQGILESGNGRSELALKSKNHFGIKCHKTWDGQRVYHDDDREGECFRKYLYVETSYNNHSEFLTKRQRYAFLFNYRIYDYKSWARGLRKAGYATDRKYPNKLIKIIEDYNLYEFDKIKKKDFTYVKPIRNKEEVTSNIPEYYKVQKGDTLYSIARQFNISVEKLKQVNKLKDNIIFIDQVLKTK